VPLLAIRGKWTNVPGVFEQDPTVVTFACAPTIEPKKQWLHEIEPFTGDPTDTRETNLEKSGGLGVLAKCYFWGFAGVGEARKSDTDRLATYQACLRAARAEYCGGGVSHTEQGTFIQVYEPTGTPAGKPTVTLDSKYCKKDKIKDPQSKQPLQFQPCFEALWDTENALCISHSRYLDMPADCRTQFSKEFKRTIDGDKVGIIKVPLGDPNAYLNCRIDDYANAVRTALVKNRSGLNKLHDKAVQSCENDIPCP